MKKGELLTGFKTMFRRPYRRAAEWKRITGKKVIGCVPMYFPDEMVHAAGALPVALFGSGEPISHADAHLMTNACDQVRSTFDSLLKGHYDFMDGVAALHVCDQVRFFIEVWQFDRPFPFFHQMWRPFKMDGSTRPFLVKELERLKSGLEKLTGNKITPQALRDSVERYNESRLLMRSVNDIRSRRPGILGAADTARIIAAGMLMPVEENITRMKQLISVLEREAIDGPEKTRIVLAGHPCAVPDTDLLDMLENYGLAVIDDDLFSGGRRCATDVILENDPVEALADSYMNALPCTTHHFPSAWMKSGGDHSPYSDHVIEMVRKGNAEAVVILRMMYCDPFDLEFVFLKKRLEEEGIPFLPLVTQHGPVPLESLRTRVQAFAEGLKTHP